MNPMMNLTVPQTQARLGIGKTRLLRLIREGQLVPTNERKPGAQKWFMRFDLKAVDALRREMRDARTPVAKAETKPSITTFLKDDYLTPRAVSAEGAVGIMTRLTHIEQKLDRLLRLWE
jgi:hypothetical protein